MKWIIVLLRFKPPIDVCGARDAEDYRVHTGEALLSERKDHADRARDLDRNTPGEVLILKIIVLLIRVHGLCVMNEHVEKPADIEILSPGLANGNVMTPVTERTCNEL